MAKKPKRLVLAEKLFDALAPSYKAPEVYRAIATAAKVKTKVIDEHLELAEKMAARFHRGRKRRKPAPSDGGF